MMGDKTKHLVRVGHEFAAAMSDDTPIITIAKMVTELASALDVQTARSDALAAALKASEANDADARCHVAELEEKCAALAAKLSDVCAENAALREYRPQPSGAAMMEALDAFYEYHEDVPEHGMMAAFEILCCKRPETPTTDAWVNEQRDAILDATFEAAKQEVERRFGRTFQDCAWLARRNSDTQMKGAVEMAEWVELYAAQLRGSQV